MSFDVDLLDKNSSIIRLPRSHAEGGTYVWGGTNDASLNITYNYSSFYYENLNADQGVEWIHDKPAHTTVDALFNAVKILGVERYTGEYWVWTVAVSIGRLLNKELTANQEEFLRFIDFDNLKIEAEALSPKLLTEAKRLKLVHDTGGYWKATPGNAGYALNILLNWALMFPNGCWSVQ